MHADAFAVYERQRWMLHPIKAPTQFLVLQGLNCLPPPVLKCQPHKQTITFVQGCVFAVITTTVATHF